VAAPASMISCLLASLALALTPYSGSAQPTAAFEDAGAADQTKPVVIYVARRSWHIDVGFAVADVEPQLDLMAAEFPQARSIFFGFGDRHYLEAKVHRGTAMSGALWPGRGLILATSLGSTPQAAFGTAQVIAIELTPYQAHAAQAYIAQSLTDEHSLARGPYEGSRYFAAAPRYSALHTCNTWAAQVLAAADLPVSSTGVIFAWQLWRQLRRLEKRQSAAQRPTAARRVTSFPQQGGARPSWHTTVVVDPAGTTTVVLAGGGGLLLLMQPESSDIATSKLARTFIIGST
jgi:hypothetical protein